MDTHSTTNEVEPELSREDRRKLKKKRKRVDAGKASQDEVADVFGSKNLVASCTAAWEADNVFPDDMKPLSIEGLQAASTPTETPRSLTHFAPQDLFLFLLAKGERPGWLHPRKWPRVQRVACLALYEEATEQLAASLFGTTTASIQCEFALTKRYQGLSTTAAMLLRPASKKHAKRRKKEVTAESVRGSIEAGINSLGWSEALERAGQLVLTPEELEREGYNTAGAEGRIGLPERAGSGEAEDSRAGRIVAVDCEMVETNNGDEVVAVVVVDGNGTVLLEELVMPEGEVKDYRTEWSGVTAAKLEGVTLRLPELQQKLCALLDKESMIVGHSLNNDLKALGLHHNRVIDTAVAYPHRRGPPSKLKLRDLTKAHLLRGIQSGTEGHSAAEDAVASMELALLKVCRGAWFGDSLPSEYDGDLSRFLDRLLPCPTPTESSPQEKEKEADGASLEGSLAVEVRCSPSDFQRCGVESRFVAAAESEGGNARASLLLVDLPQAETACDAARSHIEAAEEGTLLICLARVPGGERGGVWLATKRACRHAV